MAYGQCRTCYHCQHKLVKDDCFNKMISSCDKP